MPWRSGQATSSRPRSRERGGYFDQRVPARPRPAGGGRRAAAGVDVAARTVAVDRAQLEPVEPVGASSRGTSVTAMPGATITPRLASGSRETIDRPHLEARRRRTRGRSGCCRWARSSVPRASAVRGTGRRAPRAGGRAGSATRNVSVSSSRRSTPVVLAPLERRVLEPERDVQLPARRPARPAPASALPRAAPRPSRAAACGTSPTSALGNAPIRSRGGRAQLGQLP